MRHFFALLAAAAVVSLALVQDAQALGRRGHSGGCATGGCATGGCATGFSSGFVQSSCQGPGCGVAHAFSPSFGPSFSPGTHFLPAMAPAPLHPGVVGIPSPFYQGQLQGQPLPSVGVPSVSPGAQPGAPEAVRESRETRALPAGTELLSDPVRGQRVFALEGPHGALRQIGWLKGGKFTPVSSD